MKLMEISWISRISIHLMTHLISISLLRSISKILLKRSQINKLENQRKRRRLQLKLRKQKRRKVTSNSKSLQNKKRRNLLKRKKLHLNNFLTFSVTYLCYKRKQPLKERKLKSRWKTLIAVNHPLVRNNLMKLMRFLITLKSWRKRKK